MVDQCTKNKPLMMVIPLGGTTIHCPVHPNGHFVSAPMQVRM